MQLLPVNVQDRVRLLLGGATRRVAELTQQLLNMVQSHVSALAVDIQCPIPCLFQQYHYSFTILAVSGAAVMCHGVHQTSTTANACNLCGLSTQASSALDLKRSRDMERQLQAQVEALQQRLKVTTMPTATSHDFRVSSVLEDAARSSHVQALQEEIELKDSWMREAAAQMLAVLGRTEAVLVKDPDVPPSLRTASLSESKLAVGRLALALKRVGEPGEAAAALDAAWDQLSATIDRMLVWIEGVMQHKSQVRCACIYVAIVAGGADFR